ncbi:MAG: hypothetical protein RR942_13505 [Romboutsia sp.]
MKDKLKRIIIGFITNPITLIVYGIFCYELTTLCMYGRFNNNINTLIACIVFFVAIIAIYIIIARENKESRFKLFNSKTWKCISLIIIIVLTVFYGAKIYKSGVKYNGKLSWVIQRWQTERNIKFKENNIYEDGVRGVFEDINKRYELPEKLYMADDLSVRFNKEGIITQFDTFVYGKDKQGKEKSYLISYDKNKSKDIKLILDGFANPTYSNDKLLDPLFETVNCISIKNTVSKWNASEFGLLYKGKRNWESNREGIVLINKNGNKVPVELAGNKLVGYTVSIYVPGREEQITPVRYNLLTDSYWFKFQNTESEDALNNSKSELDLVTGNSDSKDEFYLKDGVRYKLNVDDKATGSFFYSLQQTTDGGNKWTVLNDNPFNGPTGEASGMYFIDETIGFIGISREGGSSGELYRTEDGGKSFNKLEFDSKEVTLDNGDSISPFDTPGVPYEKDGGLYLNIGQGADGDYNGNSSLIYTSKDKGQTWEYVKEVKSN